MAEISKEQRALAIKAWYAAGLDVPKKKQAVKDFPFLTEVFAEALLHVEPSKLTE